MYIINQLPYTKSMICPLNKTEGGQALEFARGAYSPFTPTRLRANSLLPGRQENLHCWHPILLGWAKAQMPESQANYRLAISQ
jgi:hypothetical protein